MQIAGLDLAAKSKNPTGFAVIDNNILFDIKLVFQDEEIIDCLSSKNYQVIAIDAPIVNDFTASRLCDKLMKKYGAMPLKLKGINDLAKRATKLIERYKNRSLENSDIEHFKIIEVFPTGTSKILDIYDHNFSEYYENVISLLENYDIATEINIDRISTKHELDAIISVFTGWLYSNNMTSDIGDSNGIIVVPDLVKIEGKIRKY